MENPESQRSPPILLSRPNSVAQEKSFCRGSIAKMKNSGDKGVALPQSSSMLDRPKWDPVE